MRGAGRPSLVVVAVGKRRRPRAFALPIVFLVLLLLAVAFGALSDTLVVASQATGRRTEAQQKFYVCEGIVRLAIGIVNDLVLDDPAMDTFDLAVALAPVRQIALENGIDITTPTPVSSAGTTRIIEEGALEGLEVLEANASFAVMDPSGGCSLNIAVPSGSVSPLQFIAFSIDGGNIDEAATLFLPNPAFTWGRSSLIANSRYRNDIEETSQATAPLRLPAPAEPEASPYVASSRTFLPYLQKPFTNNAAAASERASSRIAYQADIRIIDGEWYLRDPTNPSAWPGIPVWGDHPCANHDAPAPTCAATFFNTNAVTGRYNGPATRRRLYSAYERMGTGIIDEGFFTPGPRGIVSYGHMANQWEPGVLANGTWCGGSPTTGVRSIASCGATRKSAAIAGAREPFADPVSGEPMLPINIDVGALGAALGVLYNEEIGQFVCLRGITGCQRPFNGIVYVTSKEGALPTFGNAAYPWALCSNGGPDVSIENGVNSGNHAPQPCASAVKYNAVRLYNASSLNAFFGSGLTIATDLPMYVLGDWNRGGTFRPRTLLMADRVTALSRNWRDDMPGGSSSDIEIGGSVIAGWPAGAPTARKLNEVIRMGETGVGLTVVGSLVGGFVATTASMGAGRNVNRFTWVQPYELLVPTNEFQPPGVPRVSIGLPAEAVSTPLGGCGGG